MDRRVVWAIVLMMLIAIAPAVFFPPTRPAPVDEGQVDSVIPSDSPTVGPSIGPMAGDTAPAAAPARPSERPTSGPPADTVLVESDLYSYAFSTHGARLIATALEEYSSLAPTDDHRPVNLVLPDGALLGLTLVEGGDTVAFADLPFTASAERVTVDGPTSVTFRSQGGGRNDIELVYTFTPGEYQIGVRGRVTGVGPNGAQLLVDLGHGIRNTEVDSVENYRELALVTKHTDAERTNFRDLEAGQSRTLSGPFEWVAVKSKYFVTALFALDSAAGRIGGVTATPPATAGDDPMRADVRLTLPVPAAGTFTYTVYAGPLEYPRLTAIGHDFDDVNPYGWPGFRTLIRVFAVPVRWLLVWMHENLHLAYGVVLIVFGILVRVILWPLNQKAMRASMQMQAVQPILKDLQERHKDNPQRLQQEMFKVYKEHGVNPLGGCWPMLLPMPVLIALFFVFQNAIELRGAPFLWIPDLARPDPLYIIPIVMGLSMYVLSKVGQLGMEPNPQMKMMLYFMPAFMTFIFWRFPAGLNLYYAVSNIASIPQQWLLARERQKRTARQIVEVKTKPEKPARRASGQAGSRKR